MANIKDLKVRTDWLILEASPLEHTTDSGLVRPEAYEERSESGIIVAKGLGVGELNLGETVFFNKYATIKLVLGVEEYIVLKEEDVIAYLPASGGTPAA